MYIIEDMFSRLEVDPGTNLLIAGSLMTGKRTLAFDILASGGQNDDGASSYRRKTAASKCTPSTNLDSMVPRPQSASWTVYRSNGG
nr:hypothetical protein [Haladaptatus halobius]